MIRVCSPQLGLDPESNLGGAVYDRELLSAMVASGATVDVLVPEGSPVDESAGWTVTRTPAHRRSYYEYNWIFFKALRRHWSRKPADILRVHSPYSVGPGALVFARRAGVPIVLHYLHREPRRAWALLDRLTLSHYDLVVTISEASRRDLIRQGLAAARIVVAYPGVADKYQAPAQRETGNRVRALYIGGLLKRKNLVLAIRGVAKARARGLNLTFTLAGTGDETSALRAEIDRLNLGSAISLLGRVDEATKMSLLQAADVFLFPSILEGFGMAAAEALACGLPVIGMRTTSTGEIVADGLSGILLDDPDDDEAMTAAIEKLASEPSLRHRMGTYGEADMRSRFSWQRSAAQVLSAYRAVLEQHPTA